MAGRKSIWTALSIFALAAVPKCPVCLLALGGGLFASSLSTVGWMTVYQSALAPLTVIALMITVGALAFRFKRRRGPGPAILAFVAAAALYGGKFQLDERAVVYLGMLLLFIAMIWNSWPHVPSGDKPNAPG